MKPATCFPHLFVHQNLRTKWTPPRHRVAERCGLDHGGGNPQYCQTLRLPRRWSGVHPSDVFSRSEDFALANGAHFQDLHEPSVFRGKPSFKKESWGEKFWSYVHYVRTVRERGNWQVVQQYVQDLDKPRASSVNTFLISPDLPTLTTGIFIQKKPSPLNWK